MRRSFEPLFLRLDLCERMRANEHDSGLRISLQLSPGAWLGLHRIFGELIVSHIPEDSYRVILVVATEGTLEQSTYITNMCGAMVCLLRTNV